MSEYFDLGRYTRVVTSIPEAQVWFDRGLVWLFAYNHEEAIVCFEKAVAADPAVRWLTGASLTVSVRITTRPGKSSRLRKRGLRWHEHMQRWPPQRH